MPQLVRSEEPCPYAGFTPRDAGKNDIFPLWRLGFRPFFLFGALFSVAALAMWSLWYMGATPAAEIWEPLGGWLSWHRHEMPFGFAVAIVAGFLLTAIQNWTSRPSLSGKPLLGLFALWALARLAWLVGAPWQVAAMPEMAFLLLLAFATGRLLWRARQSHNYSAPFTIVLMAAADTLSIAGLATANDDWQRNGALAVVWLIVALMTMIGGRVIPFFTQRGLGRAAPRPAPLWLDATLMAAALVLALLSA
ncbi:MAG: NnrS family protein, partial [Azoarcus sp.]|nr:NnrS family protein [Azoarcus sp.]